jgi:tetratricopeptide (TPR) repeat protein
MRYTLLIALVALASLAPGAVAQATTSPASLTDSSRASILKRAELAYAARRWTEAAQLYQWGLEDDRSPTYRWQLAQALFNARRHREAIAAFEHALQLGAGEPAVGSWQIARAYAQQGNWKQALRWLGHAVEAGFDAREATTQEPLFEQFRGDPRFSALTDSTAGSQGSTCRLPAAWTRSPRVGEVESAQLAASGALDAREQAVGATATVDDALREVVGGVLESHFVANRSERAELGWRLPRGCRGEDQRVAARIDARVLELDD